MLGFLFGWVFFFSSFPPLSYLVTSTDFPPFTATYRVPVLGVCNLSSALLRWVPSAHGVHSAAGLLDPVGGALPGSAQILNELSLSTSSLCVTHPASFSPYVRATCFLVLPVLAAFSDVGACS